MSANIFGILNHFNLVISRAKVLIHLFTDGMDNGSVAEDVAKYQGSVGVEPQGTGSGHGKGEESLRQSFLYSLDSAFAESSALAKSLQAHLVVINESDLAAALEERDKWVLKFLAQRKVAKARSGFNLAKGYTPDLASVYKVLQKVYRYFSSSGFEFLAQEGLFRVNANVNESKRLANQLLTNSEFLNDFEDSILVAHALKTALGSSPPILPPAFQHILIEISKHVKTGKNRQLTVASNFVASLEASSSEVHSMDDSEDLIAKNDVTHAKIDATLPKNDGDDINFVLALAKPKIFELPHINLQCLHILLYLLNLVASQEQTNKMSCANLSTIFSFLLFPEVIVPNPGLQELVAILIARVNDIFPHPPQLKVTLNSSSGGSKHSENEAELQTYASKNLPVIMPIASSSQAPPFPTPSEDLDARPKVKKSVSLSATTHDLLATPSTESSPTKANVESTSANPTPISSPRVEISELSIDPSRPVNPMPPTSQNSSNLVRRPSAPPTREPPPVPMSHSKSNLSMPSNPPPPIPSPRSTSPEPSSDIAAPQE